MLSPYKGDERSGGVCLAPFKACPSNDGGLGVITIN